MSKSVSSEVSGQRITRGQAKKGTERSPTCNKTKPKALKTDITEVGPQKPVTGDRPLRSAVKQNSKKKREPEPILSAASDNAPRNLRARKNTTSQNPQERCSKSTKQTSAQTPSNKAASVKTADTKKTNVQTLLDKATSVKPVVTKKTDVQTSSDKATSVKPVVTKKTDVQTLSDKATSVKPVVTKKTDVQTLSVKVTSCKTMAMKKSNVQSPLARAASVKIVENKKSNIQTPLNKRASAKTAETPERQKNPVYKQAIKDSLFFKTTVDDEYEFQAETPDGIRKKVKKRQPRLKNTIQTLWGLKVKSDLKKKLKPCKKVIIQEPENLKPASRVVQSTVASKNAVPIVKKALTPLQERTCNTLGPTVTSSVASVYDKHSGTLVSSVDGKKITNKSTSEDISKLAHLRNKQTDELKENRPLVKDKPVDSPALKHFQMPQKARVLSAPSNSTPVQTVPSQTLNNLSGLLSPIHVASACPTKNSNQILRRNNIHASTPVRSNMSKHCAEPSDVLISLKQISATASQSTNQKSIPSSKFRQCIPQSITKETPPRQSHDNGHQSSNSTPDFIEDLPEMGSDIPNDDENPSVSSDAVCPQQRSHSAEKATKKQVPVSKTTSTWRLGSTARYSFNINPSLDNCFGFDDDDTDLTDVNQAMLLTQPAASHLPQKKLNPQLVKKPCTQIQDKPGTLNQESTCPLAKKRPCNMSQSMLFMQPLNKPCDEKKRSALQEKQASIQSPSSTPQPQKDIDELLNSSVVKLRKKNKGEEDSFFKNITSEVLSKPSSSSQLISKDRGDTITNTSHLPTLFDDFEKDNVYKSPFSEPPRRSYACLRPMKRRAYEDAEDSDGNEERGEHKQNPPKRTKTVYKRKKVQTTLVDQWAKELSSHFAEVDDTILVTE